MVYWLNVKSVNMLYDRPEFLKTSVSRNIVFQ